MYTERNTVDTIVYFYTNIQVRRFLKAVIYAIGLLGYYKLGKETMSSETMNE